MGSHNYSKAWVAMDTTTTQPPKLTVLYHTSISDTRNPIKRTIPEMVMILPAERQNSADSSMQVPCNVESISNWPKTNINIYKSSHDARCQQSPQVRGRAVKIMEAHEICLCLHEAIIFGLEYLCRFKHLEAIRKHESRLDLRDTSWS